MDDKKQQRIAELSNVDAYFGEEKDFKKELAYIGGSAVGLIAAAVGAVFVKNNSYKYTLIIAAFFLAFMIADIARSVIREKQVLKIIKPYKMGFRIDYIIISQAHSKAYHKGSENKNDKSEHDRQSE